MRISKIEYENFRNFKDPGAIYCSTDGKVTIIYGKNGDGKTTLHQLLQWIFYGQVHFNKTTTDRLYNLQYENECEYNSTFHVRGCIDFEHDGVKYSVTRTYMYRKGLTDSEKIGEDFTLTKMDDDYNWLRIERPKDTIEKLLPSGLSDYFFFDGESMIADLRVKGKDSAGKLRKALYSMFDLDIIESAISHVGRTDLKTTVLGKLYLSKGTISSGGEISSIKTNIENAQAKLDGFGNELEQATKRKTELHEISKRISEQIGGIKTKADYEKQRKSLKNQRDIFLKNADNAQAAFGESVFAMFPNLLISKAVNDAKQKIHLKVEQTKLPSGLSKKLVAYLQKQSTSECICGNPLCEAERQHIAAYLELFPPKSFSSFYHEFSKEAKDFERNYNKSLIENYIQTVLDNVEQAEICDESIRELDEAEKNSPDVENLVIDRQKAEAEITELDETINKLNINIKKFERYLKQQMDAFDKATKENASCEKALMRIEIMEQVAAYFRTKLDEASVAYSQKLEHNIQELINQMLTSKRTVSVSSEFSVRVTDSFNDESKSEGQFAVVSFAYIGGILNMLRSEENLESKEYPLVLDGPFSKLDPDQRHNVINMIPRFAPQVIIFSKDDLHDDFDSEHIGRTWTIISNEEKNVATIEEGHLWK